MKEKLLKINYLNIVITLLMVAILFVRIENNLLKYISCITVVIISVVLSIVLKKLDSKKIKFEYYYLIFAIILGILYLIFLPVAENPDSNADYLRSLEISNFNITTPIKDGKVGREYPKTIDKVYRLVRIKNVKYKDVKETLDYKLEGDTKFYEYANKAFYAFPCYIPQAVGIGIGRLLNLPIYYQSIIGRAFNYAVFVFFVFLAIKFIPVKKELVFLIALLPITIQEAISLSPDCITIATSILFVSLIVHFKVSKNILSKKWKILLFLIAILLSLSKIVYVPICFLIFLLPNECFKTKKEKYVYCMLLSFVSLGINLLWLTKSSQYLVAYKAITDSKQQLQFIMDHPLRYVLIMINTFEVFCIDWINQLIGYALGRYHIGIPAIIITIFFVLLLRSIISNSNNNKKRLFNKFNMLYITAIVMIVAVLICNSLYLECTPLFVGHIDGIQGRYFTPLLLIISMIFMDNNKEKENNNNSLIRYTVLANILAIVFIINYFI